MVIKFKYKFGVYYEMVDITDEEDIRNLLGLTYDKYGYVMMSIKRYGSDQEEDTYFVDFNRYKYMSDSVIDEFLKGETYQNFVSEFRKRKITKILGNE